MARCRVVSRRIQLGKSRERGAALVEALTIIPLFILFFAASIYMYRVFAQQLDALWTARTQTMAFALIGCQGDAAAVVHAKEVRQNENLPALPGGQAPQAPTTVDTSGGGKGETEAQTAVDSSKESLSLMRHHTMMAERKADVGGSFATRTMKSTSQVMCSDRTQKDSLRNFAWAKNLWDLFRSLFNFG